LPYCSKADERFGERQYAIERGTGLVAGDKTTDSGLDYFSNADAARAIVETSLDSIVAFGEDGRITAVNPATISIFGFSVEDILGQPIESLIIGQSQSEPEIGTGVPWDKLAAQPGFHECMGRHRSGEALDLELGISVARIDGNRIYIVFARDISARKRQDAETRYQAHFDSLTGLPNRVLFEERVGQAINQSKRTEGWLALMMLDLDRFKAVNDSLGHQVGDKLLAAVANRLRTCVRETDTVTRLGGDEFAVLITNLNDANGAATVAETIVASLNQPFDIDGERLSTSASIGITNFPDDGSEVEVLIRNADRALYRAKAKGRNTYQFYVPEMDAIVQAQKALERDLREALDGGKLSLDYQPVTAVNGEITGVEALLRWKDKERGQLSAHDFIPAVERTDLILLLGKWVMREACGQARAWQEAGLPSLRLSINLSPAELRHRDLVTEVESILAETGLDPRILQLEFSEEAFLLAVQKNPTAIGHLREMGVGISLDNFGSGVSSIEFLKRHPVDRFKIDRTFLEKLSGDKNGDALLGPLVELAKGLGAGVTVECVETREHLEEALARGVKEMQGHFISKPVGAERFAEMVRSGKPLHSGNDGSGRE
jgi:diguanylate cyclase (GGDEF)-like protein/PAS domain S-box-containing protein